MAFEQLPTPQIPLESENPTAMLPAAGAHGALLAGAYPPFAQPQLLPTLAASPATTGYNPFTDTTFGTPFIGNLKDKKDDQGAEDAPANLAFNVFDAPGTTSDLNYGSVLRLGDNSRASAVKTLPEISIQAHDPSHKVEFAPQTTTIQIKCNGEVDLNGQVLRDPATLSAFMLNPNNTAKNIVINVDKNPQEQGFDAAQKNLLKSVTNIVAMSVQQRYQAELPTVEGANGELIHQVKIDDPTQLLPEETKAKFGNRPDQALDLPQPSTDLQNMNNSINAIESTGEGGQTFSAQQIGDQIPKADQDVPQTRDAVSMQNALDMIAALNKGNHETGSNYDAVHVQPDGSYRIGRYGINQNLMASFFESVLSPEMVQELGGPPLNWAKLSEFLNQHPELKKKFEMAMRQAIDKMSTNLIKEGTDSNNPAISRAGRNLRHFADNFNKDPKFADGFVNFINKLDGQQGKVTAGDVNKFMPKALQELLVQNRMKAFANGIVPDQNLEHMTAQQASQLALCIYLGHAQLTAADENDPLAKKFMNNAMHFYMLDRLRTDNNNSDVSVAGMGGKGMIAFANNLVEHANDLVGQRVWAMTPWQNVVHEGKLGCAATVSYILKASGEKIAGSPSVYGLIDELEHKGWQKIKAYSRSDIKAGDVLAYLGSNREHIGVAAGSGLEFDNSSSSRTLKLRKIAGSESFDPAQGEPVYILRKPGDC